MPLTDAFLRWHDAYDAYDANSLLSVKFIIGRAGRAYFFINTYLKHPYVYCKVKSLTLYIYTMNTPPLPIMLYVYSKIKYA